MSKLVLIDGHSILNRAFYGVPDLSNSAGLHTNAVFGFLNILFLGVGRVCISHCKTARPERGTGVPNIYGGRRLVEGLVGQRNKCFTNVLLAVFFTQRLRALSGAPPR